MTRSLLSTYGAIVLIAAVWVGLFSSLQPTHAVEVVLSFIVFFMAMTGAIATGSRVSAGEALHGKKFAERSQRLAHPFSTTKIAGEYRTYKQFVTASTATIVVGLATRRAAPVVLSAMALNTAQFFMFWRAAKRVPPSVLVLGSSCPTFGADVHALRAALHPHRIIVLLDIPESSPRQDIDRLDNFRTTGEWHPLLHVLLEAAPVVVIDARVETSNLTVPGGGQGFRWSSPGGIASNSLDFKCT